MTLIINCFYGLGYFLFFMMLFVPYVYQPIKGVLLALVFTPIVIHSLYRGRISLHLEVVMWTLFVVSINISYLCLGLINENIGALRNVTAFVLWPLLFTIILSKTSNEQVLKNLIRLTIVSLIAIGLYDLSYILTIYGWLPESLYIQLDQGQVFGFQEKYIEFALHNINSLFFLVPFCIAALLTWPKNMSINVHRFWIWISLTLGLTVSFLSARRALILLIAMAPFITLFFRAFLPDYIKRINRMQMIRMFNIIIILIIIIFIYLLYIHGISILASIESVFSGGDEGDSIRKEQFYALLEAWEESPIIGAGLGAPVPGYIRSPEMPWVYELFYMAMLFHTGLLGIIAYAIAIAWIYWKGLIIIRSGDETGLYMLPMLVAMSCFLIANGSNPYLMTFDSMWVIFFPIAFINFWMLKSRKTAMNPWAGSCLKETKPHCQDRYRYEP